MANITHVRQTDQYGCTLACLAMILGQPYDEVRGDFEMVGRGYTHHSWQEYLAVKGFAVQHVWKHDARQKRDRDPWPLSPWADIQLCGVDAGGGAGTHLIVLLKDGTVLDPISDVPRKWSEYGGVSYMAAIVRAPTSPVMSSEPTP